MIVRIDLGVLPGESVGLDTVIGPNAIIEYPEVGSTFPLWMGMKRIVGVVISVNEKTSEIEVQYKDEEAEPLKTHYSHVGFGIGGYMKEFTNNGDGTKTINRLQLLEVSVYHKPEKTDGGNKKL